MRILYKTFLAVVESLGFIYIKEFVRIYARKKQGRKAERKERPGLVPGKSFLLSFSGEKNSFVT